MTPSTPRPARSRIERRVRRSIANRGAFPYLALATAILAVITGTIATIIDNKDFPTLEDGIWWSIVTLSTVGYGDIVPHSLWGRLLGSVVIIIGVTFLSFLTAFVTSLFLASEQEEAEERRSTEADQTQEVLGRIEERLAAIEASLGAQQGNGT